MILYTRLYIRCMLVVIVRVYNVDLYLFFFFSLGIDRTRRIRHTSLRSVCNNSLSHWALFTDRYIFILNLNIRFYSTNTYIVVYNTPVYMYFSIYPLFRLYPLMFRARGDYMHVSIYMYVCM